MRVKLRQIFAHVNLIHGKYGTNTINSSHTKRIGRLNL